jgi:hypothetical protein
VSHQEFYERVPRKVRAIRYNGTNCGEVMDFVDLGKYMVTEEVVPMYGIRGVEKALKVWSIQQSVGVRSGSWLLMGEKGIWSMTDEEFTSDYLPAGSEGADS